MMTDHKIFLNTNIYLLKNLQTVAYSTLCSHSGLLHKIEIKALQRHTYIHTSTFHFEKLTPLPPPKKHTLNLQLLLKGTFAR